MDSTDQKKKTKKKPLNPPREYKRLGSKIRKRRRELDLTQEKLAVRAKISLVYVGYIENGSRAPSLPILRRIARALGVPLEDFFSKKE